MIPLVFSLTTTPLGFIQNVLTRSSYLFVLYTILLSYNSSVRCLNTSAGSSTLTPISTRFDFVGISRSEHTVSIQCEPERPAEMIHFLHSYSCPPASILKPSFSSPIIRTFSTGVLKWNSTLSFNSSKSFSRTT